MSPYGFTCAKPAFRATVGRMNHELSPQTEQYLASMVAGGQYPTKEAALEAAVEALRQRNEEIPFVPDEHMPAVEQAIASSRAGHSTPMTRTDWNELRQLAHDVAADNSPSRG